MSADTLRRALLLALAVVAAKSAPAAADEDGTWLARLRPWPAVEVQDQAGRRLAFAPDLLRGRLVLLDLVFTGCGTTCPLLTAYLAEALDRLPGQVRDRVRAVSLSVDPWNDSPAELARFAAEHGAARDAWSFVVSAPDELPALLAALNDRSPAGPPAGHTSLVYVLDDTAGAWTRVDGLGGPEPIARRVCERFPDQAGACSAAGLLAEAGDGR